MLVNSTKYNAQKIKLSIKDFFSKCDQIRRILRICSYLLKKSLLGNFIFCAVISFVELRKRLWGEHKITYSWFSVFLTAKNSFQNKMEVLILILLFMYFECVWAAVPAWQVLIHVIPVIPLSRNIHIKTKNLGTIVGLNITYVHMSRRYRLVCAFF